MFQNKAIKLLKCTPFIFFDYSTFVFVNDFFSQILSGSMFSKTSFLYFKVRTNKKRALRLLCISFFQSFEMTNKKTQNGENPVFQTNR